MRYRPIEITAIIINIIIIVVVIIIRCRVQRWCWTVTRKGRGGITRVAGSILVWCAVCVGCRDCRRLRSGVQAYP